MIAGSAALIAVAVGAAVLLRSPKDYGATPGAGEPGASAGAAEDHGAAPGAGEPGASAGAPEDRGAAPGAGEPSSSADAAKDGAVAQVGEHGITARMLQLRRRQIDMYYPGSGSPEAALAQLIQGYLAAEVLRAQGVHLDRAAWISERARIEAHTRDRELLDRVKAVYDGDEEAYLYAGVLPDFARARLETYFRSTPKFHEATRAAAAQFLDETTATPGSFAAAASKRGLAVSRLTIVPGEGVWEKGPLDAGERGLDGAAATRLAGLLATLAAGAVHPNTLETPETFDAVRLLSRRGGTALEIELVSFPKPHVSQWLWTEAVKVKVAVNDPELAAAFSQKISWAPQLSLEPRTGRNR